MPTRQASAPGLRQRVAAFLLNQQLLLTAWILSDVISLWNTHGRLKAPGTGRLSHTSAQPLSQPATKGTEKLSFSRSCTPNSWWAGLKQNYKVRKVWLWGLHVSHSGNPAVSWPGSTPCILSNLGVNGLPNPLWKADFAEIFYRVWKLRNKYQVMNWKPL